MKVIQKYTTFLKKSKKNLKSLEKQKITKKVKKKIRKLKKSTRVENLLFGQRKKYVSIQN